jgi:hypothetical protein
MQSHSLTVHLFKAKSMMRDMACLQLHVHAGGVPGRGRQRVAVLVRRQLGAQLLRAGRPRTLLHSVARACSAAGSNFVLKQPLLAVSRRAFRFRFLQEEYDFPLGVPLGSAQRCVANIYLCCNISAVYVRGSQ